MGIKTASVGVDDPKDPDASNIVQFYKLVASETEVAAMVEEHERRQEDVGRQPPDRVGGCAGKRAHGDRQSARQAR